MKLATKSVLHINRTYAKQTKLLERGKQEHMRIQSHDLITYNKNKRSFSINPLAPHSSRIRKILPTHDPCNKLHQVRSVEQLAHKDRHCITIHQRMPIPIGAILDLNPISDQSRLIDCLHYVVASKYHYFWFWIFQIIPTGDPLYRQRGRAELLVFSCCQKVEQWVFRVVKELNNENRWRVPDRIDRPSGTVLFNVCSITLLPANAIQALGSAIMISPQHTKTSCHSTRSRGCKN